MADIPKGNTFERVEVSQQLKEILEAEPKVTFTEWSTGNELKIALPYESFIRANLDGASADIGYFSVNEELRGNGIAERLMNLLVVEVKNRGIKVLTASIESVASLKVILKVFGKENVNLHPDFEIHGKEAKNIFVTPEEAIKRINLKEYVECDISLAN